MKPHVLLVNPPIYDFSAYDFWLKPYGMLRLAGFLRRRAAFCLVDFLDRLDSRVPVGNYRSDPWGRGVFYSEPVEKPPAFGGIPREFRRYGLPRDALQGVLGSQSSFDYALVQTGMTYWYPGVREVVGEIRRLAPTTKIILGGVYATLCPAHARSLGVDLVVEGSDLGPLWRFIGIAPETDQLPFWDLYPKLQTGVLKLADGCPFRCTYCSVPQVNPQFRARPLDHSLAELSFLYKLGVRDVAFYDDALLYRPAQVLGPFLREALRRGIQVRFHTPNAMNARFIDNAMACLLIAAGFKNIYLGFESSAYAWQKKTGGKVYSEELERAVENLVSAGADVRQLHAYLIAGHPNDEEQAVEDSMRFAHELGLRVMLSEFSPIPGTPDGESCRRWIDMDEPLGHNKTAFAIQRLGVEEINRLKTLGGRLNRKLGQDYAEAGSRSLLQADPGLL
jgi:pyruvate-formate lyase-activating enzyme